MHAIEGSGLECHKSGFHLDFGSLSASAEISHANFSYVKKMSL